MPSVSPKPASAARQLGTRLSQQVWQDQPAFDLRRDGAYLEHFVPVLTVRSACLSASDQDAVVEALIGIEIAWILKSEDAELNRLGYRSRRSDPAAAYRHAGIQLIHCSHT